MGYLSQQIDGPPPMFQALEKQDIYVTSKENPMRISAFWESTLTHSSLASTDSIASLIRASPTSWVPLGSSSHYLECSAWCLSDSVLSRWLPQYFPFFQCIFHPSRLLGGPCAPAKKTKDPRSQLCILISKLCFWVSTSKLRVSRSSCRALCLSCVSLSVPTTRVPHLEIPCMCVRRHNTGRIFSELQVVGNIVRKMWVFMIYQLPKCLATDFYELFNLQDAHRYFLKCKPNKEELLVLFKTVINLC